ncbi:DUF697 domain-containing protein [bacterium]|nr:DUF697 domain-containing protein [bacterium]
MKLWKRFVLFIFIVFAYLLIKEFLVLFQAAKSVHPAAAYTLVAVLLILTGYFILVPLVSIIRLPKTYGPTRNPDQIQTIIEKRIKRFQKNPYLSRQGFDFNSITPDRAGYDRAIEALQPAVKKLHKRYVTQVFYTTAIAQNGFLDAVFILVLSVNLIRDLFVLYHGRVSGRDLAVIGRLVFQSMLIGGSEGVEYAMDEVFSKLFSGSMKGIPFASKVLGSLADGFVNAALMTRTALITQSYCEMVFIESDRALYPAYKTVTSATRILISDLVDRIGDEVRSMARRKAGEAVLVTVNPVGYIISKAMNRMADGSETLSPQQREWMRETSDVAYNPFGFLAGKVRGLFRKDRETLDLF